MVFHFIVLLGFCNAFVHTYQIIIHVILIYRDKPYWINRKWRVVKPPYKTFMVHFISYATKIDFPAIKLCVIYIFCTFV